MKAEADSLPASPSRLPLFPLSSWLYPGISLGLQVFEARYLDMLRAQLKKGEGFGIVPIREGREVGKAPNIYPLGVEVRVADWHQLANGVLGLTVIGERKFRVLESEIQPDQLMVARVAYLRDDPPGPIPERYDGLAELLKQLKEHPATVTMGLPQATDSSELSYQLAQVLPLSSQEQMAVLAMADAEERLGFIAQKVGQLAQE
jgi:Lon protease-like protein